MVGEPISSRHREYYISILKHAPKDSPISLEEIYSLIESKIDFTSEELNGTINWKRNVRNSLQYFRNNGLLEWLGGAKYIVHNYDQIQSGTTMRSDEISALFGGTVQGGMRRSLPNNNLMLISKQDNPLYYDRWDDNTFFYTGMGSTGDQDINWSQNRILNESNETDVSVFLFEQFFSKELIFQGKVRLSGDPFQEEQIDLEGNSRSVWVFPLQIADASTPIPIKEEIFIDQNERFAKQARRLSDEELERRAKLAKSVTGRRLVTSSSQYVRNKYVAENAKRRADGVCQLCGNSAPFNNKRDEPYLEEHHIIWLANDGPDTIENTVALCPNCHRKMHELNKKRDVETLTRIAARAPK